MGWLAGRQAGWLRGRRRPLRPRWLSLSPSPPRAARSLEEVAVLVEDGTTWHQADEGGAPRVAWRERGGGWACGWVGGWVAWQSTAQLAARTRPPPTHTPLTRGDAPLCLNVCGLHRLLPHHHIHIHARGVLLVLARQDLCVGWGVGWVIEGAGVRAGSRQGGGARSSPRPRPVSHPPTPPTRQHTPTCTLSNRSRANTFCRVLRPSFML